MRVLFFHGFESKLPSKKAEWLKEMGHEVYALDMGYTRDDAFFKALACALEFKPELIVGSSMGGYFATRVGTHIETKLVLLNPALHSRSKDFDCGVDGDRVSRAWVLLGERDTIIDPEQSLDALNGMGAKITYGSHAHRTPQEVFAQYMTSIMPELTLDEEPGPNGELL